MNLTVNEIKKLEPGTVVSMVTRTVPTMKFGKSKIVSKEKRVILKTKGQYLFTMKPSMFKSVLFAASKNGINYEKCTDFVKFIDKMDKKIESEYIDEVYEILYEGNILEDYNGNLVEVSI